MVSSTLAASLTYLSLFSCDSILFSFSPSLSFLGGSILLEEPRLVSLLLLLTQLVFLCLLSTYLRALSLFCLSPSNWQLLSQCFSLRSLARCSVLEIFSKPKTKTKYNFIFLPGFCLGLFETNYVSFCKNAILLHQRRFTLVFDTPFSGNPLLARDKIRRKSYGNDSARENTRFRIRPLIEL